MRFRHEVGPGIIFPSSVDEFMTTSEFLTMPGEGGVTGRLVAARSELNRFQAVLDTRVELEAVEAQKLDARTNQESAMEAMRPMPNCRAAAKSSPPSTTGNRQAAPGPQRASGLVQVGSFICPFTPGRTSFIDSWGAPRSGGRPQGDRLVRRLERADVCGRAGSCRAGQQWPRG